MSELLLPIVMALLIAPVLTYTLTRYIIRWLELKGFTGRDVHKPWHPEVAEPGGIALIISYLILSLIVSLSPVINTYKVLAVSLSALFAGLVGLVDDFKVLKARTKTVLAFTAATPIILLHAYDPRPIMPFAGPLRLTILYPILLPFAYAVVLNAVNMADTHNGVIPGTGLLVGGVLLFSSLSAYIKGYTDATGVILSLLFIGLLVGYIKYNWFPAKVFNGDSGSFLIGALIAGIAVVSRAEVPVIIALMVYIVNGFQILLSIKGLVERRQIGVRPVRVEDGWIKANPDKRAPITIPHLLTLKEPLNEKEIVFGYMVLAGFSCLLGIITAIICYWL